MTKSYALTSTPQTARSAKPSRTNNSWSFSTAVSHLLLTLILVNSQVPAFAELTNTTTTSTGYPSSKLTGKKDVKVIDKPVTDLWARIRNGLGMDLNNRNARVLAELRWYRKNQRYFDRVSERAMPYLYFIVNEAEKRGVPMELALMPVVESAFDPFAFSHAGASGLWQFMPSTGRHYGLKQNWWYDGRRDVITATQAALDYMVALNEQFDDWELALAAFNSGPGRVSAAVNKNRKAGKSVRFWDLNLPKETTAYVPKLIALGKIVRKPSKYGIKLKSIPNKPYFATVATDGQLDMSKAAELSGVPLNELYRLNPAINRWSTPPSGPHRLLIPISRADQFRERLANLPESERTQWFRYTVKSGDSLSLIAQNYGSQTKIIKEVNHMDNDVIRVGQTLFVPVDGKKNRIPTSYQKIIYRVKSGDSFWTVAKKYNTTTSELAKWNDMSGKEKLKIGQTLTVWKRKATTETKDLIIRKVFYTVRKGDSLSQIADKFNVGVTQIRNWNSFNSKYLQPGQRLTLYVDVTRTYD